MYRTTAGGYRRLREGILALLAGGLLGVCRPVVVPPPTVYAETVQTCFDYTLRLRIVSRHGAEAPPPPLISPPLELASVHGLAWVLEVDGPPAGAPLESRDLHPPA